METDSTPKEFKEIEENHRPQFLTVLCILTFIGSGFAVLSSLGFTVAYDSLIYLIESNPMLEDYDFVQSDFMISALLSIASLVGAIFMFKLKRIGFFIYLLSNLTAAFLPEYSTFSLVFNIIWISMYAANYKALK